MTPIEIINRLDELLPLNKRVKYDIYTPERTAMFLAQIYHESMCLQLVRENMNYSAKRLLEIFPRYFNITTAQDYAYRPQDIGNIVYANRMGNGDVTSGDGYCYRGGGYLQITGKNNYSSLSKDTGIDFLHEPELIRNSDNAMLSALWFWKTNNLNAYINDIVTLNNTLLTHQVVGDPDIIAVTKKINGGTNGLKERSDTYNYFLQVLKENI